MCKPESEWFLLAQSQNQKNNIKVERKWKSSWQFFSITAMLSPRNSFQKIKQLIGTTILDKYYAFMFD